MRTLHFNNMNFQVQTANNAYDNNKCQAYVRLASDLVWQTNSIVCIYRSDGENNHHSKSLRHTLQCNISITQKPEHRVSLPQTVVN